MSNAKDIATRLFDFAAQEGCDGEPYDTMQAAGEHIRDLQAQLARVRELPGKWRSEIAEDGLPDHYFPGLDYAATELEAALDDTKSE